MQKHEREALRTIRQMAQSAGGDAKHTTGGRGHTKIEITIGEKTRLVTISSSPINRDNALNNIRQAAGRAIREMTKSD